MDKKSTAERLSPMPTGEVKYSIRIYNQNGEVLLWEASGSAAIPVPNVGEYACVVNDRGHGDHWTVERREFIYTPLSCVVDLHCTPRKV